MATEIESKDFVVSGYTFHTKEQAQEAKDELNAIKYLSKKTDGKDPKQVYILYNKVIDRRLFRTPVGYNYLKELQQFMYLSDDIPNEKIRPIPINAVTQTAMDRRKERTEHRSELHDLSVQVVKYKDRFIKTAIINGIMLIAIIVMLFIVLSSKNANIINYEVNIQDKYAQWQEQLESQEQSLKARENELNQKK